MSNSQVQAARQAIALERKQRGGPPELPIYAEVTIHFKDPILGPHSADPTRVVSHRSAVYVLSGVGNHAVVAVQEQGEEGTHHLYKWDDVVRIEAIPSRLTPPLAS